MSGRTAVVAGATGLVGGHLVRRLTEDADYGRVVAVTRRPLDEAHPKLETRVVDYDRLADVGLGVESADAFCALGTTIKKAGSQDAFRRVDLDYVRAFAVAADAWGAATFVTVSALGANPKSRVFYNRVKGEAEAAVRAVGIRSTHVLRPSLLLGERAESRPGERAGIAFARAVEPALVGPLRRYRGVRAEDVAAAMVALAKRDGPGFHVHEGEEIAKLAADALQP